MESTTADAAPQGAQSKALLPGQARVLAEARIKVELWQAVRENRQQAWVLAVTLFYLSGFLVLNAHLAGFAIAELAIVSTRYVLAASNFAAFLLFYIIFALRPVLFIHEFITATGQRVSTTGRRTWLWAAVVAARSVAHPLFLHCFAASFYSYVAMGQARTGGMYFALLSIVFGVSYMIETSGLATRFPRATELVDLIADLTGVAVFFASIGSPTTTVFWQYLGLSLYLNFSLDMMSRRNPGWSAYAFFLANTVVSVLTMAIAFGAQLFDKVTQNVGGGAPFDVEVSLADQARVPLFGASAKTESPFKAKLIYQTEQYLFLSHLDRTLRIRNDDVTLLSISPQKKAAPVEPSASAASAPATPASSASR
jgi:hypothetical protein